MDDRSFSEYMSEAVEHAEDCVEALANALRALFGQIGEILGDMAVEVSEDPRRKRSGMTPGEYRNAARYAGEQAHAKAVTYGRVIAQAKAWRSIRYRKYRKRIDDRMHGGLPCICT